MRSQLIFKAPFFSQEDIKLANLIPNINDPELDNLESPISLVLDKDYTVKSISDFQSFFESKKESKLEALLSRVAKLSIQKGGDSSGALSSQQGNIHTVKSPAAVFRNLCATSEAREWLQEQIEDGMEVHFVIGYVTFLDARAHDLTASNSTLSGEAQIPVAEMVGGVPFGDVLDVKIAAGHSGNQQRSRQYLAPGEQIFGLRVKKITFKFWRSKNVDSANLEKNSSWQMVSDNRAASDQASEWVEASLEGEDSDQDDSDFDISYIDVE